MAHVGSGTIVRAIVGTIILLVRHLIVSGCAANGLAMFLPAEASTEKLGGYFIWNHGGDSYNYRNEQYYSAYLAIHTKSPSQRANGTKYNLPAPHPKNRHLLLTWLHSTNPIFADVLAIDHRVCYRFHMADSSTVAFKIEN